MRTLLTSLCLTLLVALPFAAKAEEAPAVKQVSKEEVLVITPKDKVLGNADAPITMIEYASLSCSHCADFHLNVLPKIKETYIETGKVKLVMRDFPLNEPALRASMLAHCATDEDTYHRLNNAIFRTQSSWVGKKNYLELLGNIGKLAGISAEQYDACLKDKDLELHLLTQKLDGAKAFNINATPSFVINGELHSGGQDYEFYQEIFDELLKK